MSPSGPHGGGSATSHDRMLEDVIEYLAQHGVGNTSLRQIAAGIGSSHRMLLYHFGSRAGLLTAVVEAMERREQQGLSEMMAGHHEDGRVLAWRFWSRIADSSVHHGPLYFELAGRAMRQDDAGAPLRGPNVEMWVRALTELWLRGSALSHAEARAQARLNLAVARGLLHDLLLTGDREAADTAMARFDFLSFGTPHPDPEVRPMVDGWWRVPRPE